MIHRTTCLECSDKHENNRVYCQGELDSDLIALCECQFGHKTLIRVNHNLFDVLYTSAVYAFSNNCLSESVLSFAASLERTYEMFIKVTMFSQGSTYEQIDDFWKELSKQSERQYGAFCSQYLNITKEVWTVESSMVAFRNNVTHKGYIATTVEVTKYANYVTERLYKILKVIHSTYEKQSVEFYFHEAKKTSNKYIDLKRKHKARSAGSSTISLLNWNEMDFPKPTFNEALLMMASYKYHLMPQ